MKTKPRSRQTSPKTKSRETSPTKGSTKATRKVKSTNSLQDEAREPLLKNRSKENLSLEAQNDGSPKKGVVGTGEKEPTSVLRLIICFLGINICYLYYGVIQERLFRPDPRANNQKFDNTLFLFGVQCLMNAMFALAMRSFNGSSSQSVSLFQDSKTTPLKRVYPKVNGWMWLGFISASYLLAMLTSNEALRYVSYPMQALAKSCKMVPVMLGNALVGVKYKWHEYLIVLMITVGITLSQQSGSKGSKDSTLTGMVLLFVSLTLDGVTGSHQHLFDHEYKLSTHDLMLGMNAFALLYTSAALIFTGEGARGLDYVLSYPWIQKDVFLFGLASALGQNFIFYTITGPGPLVCTTITTMRKFFTILYSVFSYEDNKFSSQQWMGTILVFSGLGAEIVEKAMKKRKKQ